ncbi:hypothetical protein L7F22_023963 [Adiantum nelumboides]|nr:hypothetical protein [Adiantum nelumboides]
MAGLVYNTTYCVHRDLLDEVKMDSWLETAELFLSLVRDSSFQVTGYSLVSGSGLLVSSSGSGLSLVQIQQIWFTGLSLVQIQDWLVSGLVHWFWSLVSFRTGLVLEWLVLVSGSGLASGIVIYFRINSENQKHLKKACTKI